MYYFFKHSKTALWATVPFGIKHLTASRRFYLSMYIAIWLWASMTTSLWLLGIGTNNIHNTVHNLTSQKTIIKK